MKKIKTLIGALALLFSMMLLLGAAYIMWTGKDIKVFHGVCILLGFIIANKD